MEEKEVRGQTSGKKESAGRTRKEKKRTNG